MIPLFRRAVRSTQHTGLCPWNRTWPSQPCVEQGMVWWTGKQLKLQLIGGKRVLVNFLPGNTKWLHSAKENQTPEPDLGSLGVSCIGHAQH